MIALPVRSQGYPAAIRSASDGVAEPYPPLSHPPRRRLMETATRQPGIRVAMIDEEHAQGRTAELYERIKSTTGLPFVPDMFRLTSTNPRLLEVVVSGY